MPARRLVTVVLPIRNEADFIERSLRAVLAQDWPLDDLEVLVVDGDSDDGTPDLARAVLEGSGVAHEVLANPHRTVPYAMNLAIARASGDTIVRVDGHAEIDPTYVRRCVEVLASSGAQCVGGQCETVAEGATGRAIAAAQSSPFGVGNVAFRIGRPTAGPADTVPFGAYPRDVLLELGGFDEELVRNQDDELNFRLVQSGGVVWYDPSIRSRYYSRSDLRRLWRQYFQYGLYKVRVMQKRGGLASPRQVVPAAFVGSVAGGLLLTLLTRRLRWVLAPLLSYAVANTAAAAQVARRSQVEAPRVAAAFGVLHVGYGSGFLAGLWRWRRSWGREDQPRSTILRSVAPSNRRSDESVARSK